ncbi:LiaF transmembrane domain-containing protein [Levilactobacillus bambusae]|uniref:Cell wall-active antibiotics response LiaF-like C-terminal domain-containing protein n=1 Tax=Levilactobacillus bambusae TaxID=2024736 RepID=A0A2V1N008_9LACO|nr:hypothetical protein [Levilactobacillus bambusae]PWF99679.1 hypothetical protein DCM90_07640 [Levilactobacillus bambusae]
MKNYMWHKWFWGLFFLVAAAFLVTSQLGLLSIQIGWVACLLAIFFVGTLIAALSHFSVWGSAFSLAFLAIVFAKPLGIALSAWAILGTALLISIGLSILLFPFIRNHHVKWMKNKFVSHNWVDDDNWHHHGHSGHYHPNAEVDVETMYDPQTMVRATMNNTIRYIQSDHFETATIYAKMSGVKVYFDNVTVAGDHAEISVDASLSGVDLFVPRAWNVIPQLNLSMSGVTETDLGATKTGPTVYINGQLSLSGLTIHYI